MKKILLLIIVLVIVGVGALFFAEKTADVSEMATQSDGASGLKFSYRLEPVGYVLTDIKPQPEITDAEVYSLGGYQLMLEDEYRELQEAITRGDGREGPQSISVQIFENKENLSASAWADKYSAYSNVNLAFGEVDRNAVFAGAGAVRFVGDGLYSTDTIIVARSGYVFIFSGPVSGGHPIISSDYQDFLDSVEFE